MFFFKEYGDHRDLHVLTPSFPTRRSSDLHIHAEAVVAVDEDRPCADLGNGADRRPEGIRRGDDLVAGPDPQRLQRYLQGIGAGADADGVAGRSEEHTSELQSLMRTSYAVFCLKKKKNTYAYAILID